jgi:hypothetical protein
MSTPIFLKQIRMGTGSDQVQAVTINPIDQKPIRLYVGIPMWFP